MRQVDLLDMCMRTWRCRLLSSCTKQSVKCSTLCNCARQRATGAKLILLICACAHGNAGRLALHQAECYMHGALQLRKACNMQQVDLDVRICACRCRLFSICARQSATSANLIHFACVCTYKCSHARALMSRACSCQHSACLAACHHQLQPTLQRTCILDSNHIETVPKCCYTSKQALSSLCLCLCLCLNAHVVQQLH